MQRHGLTLIECLFALVLISLLLMMAIPNYQRFQQRAQLRTTQDALITALQQAKLQSLAEKQPLILCGSGDGQHCDGDWNHGWILRDNKRLHHYWPSPTSAVSIQWRGFSGEHQLRFTPALRHSALSGRFTLHRGQYSRAIIINRIGRWRVEI